MVSRYNTLVQSLGLRIWPACEAGLGAGMRRGRVPPHRRKKEKEASMTQMDSNAFDLVTLPRCEILVRGIKSWGKLFTQFEDTSNRSSVMVQFIW